MTIKGAAFILSVILAATGSPYLAVSVFLVVLA